MSLQKYLLSLEKKMIQRTNESYSKSRERSLFEAAKYHFKAHFIPPVLFFGLLALAMGFNQIIRKLDWMEIEASVKGVSTHKRYSKTGGFRYVTEYSFQYDILNKTYYGSEKLYGLPEYDIGEKVELLINPGEPTKPEFKHIEIEERIQSFGTGLLLTVLSIYIMCFSGGKKVVKAHSNKKRPHTNTRRGL